MRAISALVFTLRFIVSAELHRAAFLESLSHRSRESTVGVGPATPLESRLELARAIAICRRYVREQAELALGGK